MHFEMEELIQIVARLAEEYTAFESTSIPYEKAEQLMEAVLYCIHENELPETEENVDSAEKGTKAHNHLLVSEKKMSARQAYQSGRERVEQKTRKALELYHEILPEFRSFGNRCLYDTFIKELPEFFKWYDVKFNPQNTILTLDYPVLKDISSLTGIDKVYEFIQCIRQEQNFLNMFPEEYVMEVLEKYVERVNSDLDAGRDLVENISEIFLKAEQPEQRKRMEDVVRTFLQNIPKVNHS